MAKLGLLNNPYSLPLGNPNLIREAKRRKTVGKDQAESGLSATIEVTMVVEYEQKFINGVDPSLVYLDIIQNALTFGTSDAAFQMGSAFGKGTNKLIQNLVSGNFSAIFNALKKIVQSIFDAVKEFAGKIIDALVSPPGNGELTKALFEEPLNKAFTFTKKSFSAIIGKYKVRLMGITNALTGSPSTPWHINIGNPKKPVFSSGDMLLKTVDLELGKVLAFNDLPSTIKISLKFENARPLGAQEIFNRLNTGRGRSYIRISMQKDYNSPTENSANENEEIKNIQEVDTGDTKAQDIIATKSFDDYPYGGEGKGPTPSSDHIYAITEGEGATREDWLTYTSPSQQNGNQAASQGPVNMGEATRNDQNQVQNPSANNTSETQPSASSGVAQTSPPVNIPSASAPPFVDESLGKTPLTEDTVKSASDTEIGARLKENLKEQRDLVSIYGSSQTPRQGETSEQFQERKNSLERQMSQLDKESKLIKKEKKSRGI